MKKGNIGVGKASASGGAKTKRSTAPVSGSRVGGMGGKFESHHSHAAGYLGSKKRLLAFHTSRGKK